MAACAPPSSSIYSASRTRHQLSAGAPFRLPSWDEAQDQSRCPFAAEAPDSALECAKRVNEAVRRRSLVC